MNNLKKVVLFSCFFVLVNYVFSQNTGSFKYFITSYDSSYALNVDVLEINDRYYLLTSGTSLYSTSNAPTVTIFDKSLNQIEQIQLQLPEEDTELKLNKFFYADNHFYVFGLHWDNRPKYKCFFAKYDENFRLVQPLFVYGSDDTLRYADIDVLMTPQNEFIWMITQFDLAYQNTFSCRLLRMNDKAEVLEEVIMPYRMLAGSLAETENHYFVNNWQYPFIIKIDKDTLFKYDSININDNKNFPEGKMISVNNRLIHSLSGLEYYDCGEDWPDMFADRSILFLDDDLNTEKKLSLGVPCASNKGGVMKNMDYVNPDSIYYVYESIMDEDYSILRIANFSWDGTLNFDLTPDIPTNPSMPYRSVISCRALSNGGVLVCGEEKEYKIINSNESTRPFLLLYHPTMEVGIKEYTIKTSEIFPNPAQSQFTVTNTENATVCLYTVLGQKVKQVTDTEKNTIVQTENLPAGIYVVKVEKGNAVVTRKVQILK